MDLSRFNNGELRFWIRSDTPDIKIEIEYMTGFKSTINLISFWSPFQPNTWTMFRIPLVGAPLTNIRSPFQVTANVPGTFYTDNVRYVDSTVSRFITFPCTISAIIFLPGRSLGRLPRFRPVG